MTETILGKPIDRKDGVLKVTGRATYAAEHPLPGLVHAVVVQSSIPNGRILRIDSSKARASAGVLKVITHENAELLMPGGEYANGGEPGEERQPFQDDRIYYNGQHVGVVIAETLEQATHAAGLVAIDYASEPPALDLLRLKGTAFRPETFFGSTELQKRRGDVSAGLASAATRVDATYETPIFHHNPIEPHATIASWKDGALTLYETSQWVCGMQTVAAKTFGLDKDKVQVISPFVGGGFGCKGFVWPHTLIAAMAARQVGKPVKLVMSRQQMFSSVGRRGRTIQTIGLGCDTSGKLLAVEHRVLTETSLVGHYMEPSAVLTGMLYACPSATIAHEVVRTNLGTPTATRAPGESTGSFALESVMDELALKAGIDPLEFRILNHANEDPETGKDWSSKNLLECYRIGAERFGWAKRNPKTRSVREGAELIGWGMATATYPANRRPASARVTLSRDGTVEVSTSAHDLGTGTYTSLAQIAADQLGVSIDRVSCRIGDSSLPLSPVAGGSSTTASAGAAVYAATKALISNLIQVSVEDSNSPLHGLLIDQLKVSDGIIQTVSGAPNRPVALADVLHSASLRELSGEAKSEPAGTDAANPSLTPKQVGDKVEEPFSLHSFGAHFVEVAVDETFGTVRVRKVVSVMDVGKIVNHKTATSQVRGGAIWGIGMALLEETVFDELSGRCVSRNLADYLVPVNPDVPRIDVTFIDTPDPHINPMGARGLGEIGIVGVAAAIANAVCHATGKRIRELPIRLEALLAS